MSRELSGHNYETDADSRRSQERGGTAAGDALSQGGGDGPESPRLTGGERNVMQEIGTFRTVATEDLARYRYGGNAAAMRHELGELRGQKLITERTVTTPNGAERSVVSLTARGKEYLESSGTGRAVHAGYSLPSTVQKDIAGYARYQSAARTIEAAGGRIERVILKTELRKELSSALKNSVTAGDHTGRTEAFAAAKGLPIREGFVDLPELRIEYRNAAGKLEAQHIRVQSKASARHETPARPEPRDDDRGRERHEPTRSQTTRLEVLQDIGKFRVVHLDDLKEFRYKGNDRAMNEDLRRMRSEGLIRTNVIEKGNRPMRVIVLTKQGRDAALSGAPAEDRQAFYAGFVKPREVEHDASIYRMYQDARNEIRAQGGAIRRVVLDYELKQKVFSPLAKDRPRLSPEDYAKRQAEVAAQNGLKVVNGKIPLPDLRIEYETQEGDLTKVDLELATGHYKGSQIAEKGAAGFSIHGTGGGQQGGGTPQDHDFISEIISL
jgi:DNA-binding PadR family transcriptional regulator